jgi:hypothetical protein
MSTGRATTTPFVAPLGFTCPGDIPVAHTEGAVALDLSAFVPDLLRQVLRDLRTARDTENYSFEDLVHKVIESGRATPHITTTTAEQLAGDLLAAVLDAES